MDDSIADYKEICKAVTMQNKIVFSLVSLCNRLESPLEHEIIHEIREFLEGFVELEKCDEMLQRSLSKLSKLRAEGNLGYLEERVEKLLDMSIKNRNEINAAIGSTLYGAMSDNICKLRQVKLKEERANALRC